VKRRDFIEHSLIGAFSFVSESVFAEEYALRRGFLQARDARFKALSVCSLLLAVLFTREIYLLIVLYAFCLALAACSSIRLGFFLKRTWVFIPLFSLFIALPALFSVFTPGEPIASFRVLGMMLHITRQGIASAGFFFMRVLTSVSLCVLLVLTTRHFELLRVLRVFGVPQVFVMTLGMCYRYIYLFIEIVQNTYLAIKSRVGFISSVKKGQRVVAWNIAGLWKRSYHLNEDVYKAMLSRGYNGEARVLDDFRSGYKDWLWLISAVTFSCAIGYLQYRSGA